GSFHVAFNGADATGSIAIPNTGGWQNWQIVTRNVNLTAGTQVMRLSLDTFGASGAVGNIDYVRLTSAGGLLAQWTLDEGAGTTAADASGNNHTATLM